MGAIVLEQATLLKVDLDEAMERFVRERREMLYRGSKKRVLFVNPLRSHKPRLRTAGGADLPPNSADVGSHPLSRD
jgi:hypothetical protein